MRSTPTIVVVLTLLASVSAGCQKATPPESASGKPPGASAARTVDQPAKLEFFVMSKCPYGVQVEKGVAPVLAKLGANVDFHLAFIGQKEGDQLTSMHGPTEVAGDIAQLCARDVAPDKYVQMIACQVEDPGHIDTNWESCGQKAGLDTGAVKACIASKGQELLAASFDESSKRGATGSPTIYLNGKPYEGGRGTKDFLRAICNSYEGKKPADCENLPVPPVVSAVFLSDKRCADCNIDGLEGQLAQMVEGIRVQKLDYMTPEGKALFAELQQADPTFRALPAVLFDSSIDADQDGKTQLARYLHLLGTYQSLAIGGHFDPTAEICDNQIDDDGNGKSDCDDAGCTEAMTCRPKIEKSIDLFVMAHCPYGTKAMLAAKEFSDAFGGDATVSVDFIGDNKNGQLSSMHGPDEITDDLREVCAIEHYPAHEKFLEFLACRSTDLGADWKACTGKNGIDASVIETCAGGAEGQRLLAASFARAAAIGIQSSPTFLLNNRETFNAQAAGDISASYCKANPGLAACGKALSAAAPAQAAGGGGAACATP